MTILLPIIVLACGSAPADLIPPAAGIAKDRPRLLLRPADTPRAVSLSQLRALPRDADFARMLGQLERLDPPRAAALALVHHLTGRPEAAGRALEVMRSWQMPEDRDKANDPFHVYFTLLDMALAYDWLHSFPAFDGEAKAALGRKLQPLVDNAVRLGEDHVFHNYIWMYDGGAMLWALATAGDDPAMDRVFASLRDRFNAQLFPAMEYLEGSNGDSAGYWWLYCQSAATLVVLAAQSAFDADLAGAIRRDHGDWLARQLDYLALTILPDMRFLPWGDIVAGPNGGATHEMAGKIDALAWALRSPTGAFVSRWLAGKRGLDRFYGETAIGYFLHTRNLSVDPAPPPLAVLAGGKGGGHVVARSGWDDGATVVGFRSTDYFGQHNHLDQGSFVIYRNGWLALDAGVYGKVGGSQARTDAHSTLLLGKEGQRRQSYQSASTLEEFRRRLPRGLETGDMPFYRDAGTWTAAAGQLAQAYAPEAVRSCVRQVLFVRPGAVVVVDRLAAPEGRSLPEVEWLLQVPGRPEVEGGAVTARNEKSHLRCRALLPGGRPPRVEDSYRTAAGSSGSRGDPKVIDASRVVFPYGGAPRLTLVHLLEVGDGIPGPARDAKVETDASAVRVLLEGKTYSFSAAAPFEVAEVAGGPTGSGGPAGPDAAPAVLRGACGVEAAFERKDGRWRWAGYREPVAGREWRIGGPGLGLRTPDGRSATTGERGFDRIEATDRQVTLETALADPPLDVRQAFSFCADGRTLRVRTSLRSRGEPVVVARADLLDLQVKGERFRLMGPESVSSPVFGDRIFAGVEHPSAVCKAEGGSFSLAQPLYLEVGKNWVDLPGAVLGSASEEDVAAAGGGALRRAFLRYLDTVRVKPRDLHVHYNDWWTAPVPSSEEFVLRNIAELKKKLHDPTGFFFDSYALDAGWSNPRSVWEIDAKHFPNGFAPIRAALEAIGGRVGLWISPSSLYPFALDNRWLASAGYEVTPCPGLELNACLAKGGKYQTAFRDAALRYAREANLAHMKFDGFVGRCDEAGHGHKTGEESRLPIAEGLLEVFDALRAQKAGLALEPTCFGYRPSPWWLMHVPFIIGPFGDDSPYGRCPAPEYIESMTTAREIENLEGRDAFLLPSSALQCFDIIVQCPGPFQNHAAMAIGRGRWFLSSYIDPKFMDAEEWRFLADLVRWARHNRALLQEPLPIGGDPAKREVYGYSFLGDARQVHCVRNPWMEEARIALPAPPAAKVGAEVRMLYPRRGVIARAAPGAALPQIPLGPYETQFVEVVPTDLPPLDPPAWPAAVAWRAAREPWIECTVFAPDPPALGPSWTSPDGEADRRTTFVVEGRLEMGEARDAQLCILCEGDPAVSGNACRMALDGKDAAVSVSGSKGAFGAAGAGPKEHWVWFLADVPSGEHDVRIEVTGPALAVPVGVFLRGLAAAPAPAAPFDAGPAFPLWRADRRPWSRVLVPLAARKADPARTRTAVREVARIDGVFLDALEWIEASTGWGRAQKNRSIMEKPMALGGKSFPRGIGAHARSRIAWRVPEGHVTFAATIGKDQEVAGGSVVFAVQADGREVFRSGVFRNDTPLREISVPIAGARELALIVEDAGDGIAADHADWAEARLLRLDRDAVLGEIRDLSLAGMDRRLGPDHASFHPGEEEKLPEVWMAPSRQEAGGRRYQIGGPWSKEAGDFSSTQGQVLYAPDRGIGVDRVTVLEWSNGCFSERPEPPWWGGFRPEPASAKWREAAGGSPGAPVAMARGMGSWANCGVIVFSSGLVATAGTCTAAGSDPTFRFPARKIPTAVSVTNKNEFALVTVCDVEERKGQVAVLALEGSGRRNGFAHEWRDDHPCLPNVAILTRIKLLGYVDLPGIEYPTAVTAVGDREGGRVNGLDGNAGMLREFDLARQSFRDMFRTGSNSGYSSTAGFAVAVSKYEGKAAFIDLQPLFQRVREMYFTTEENYRLTRDSGPDPKQWPYAFEADSAWQPQVVKVVDVLRPMAVIASMSGGERARAFIASEDGAVGAWRVGGLATAAPAAAAEIERAGEVQVGRNPTCLAYQKYSADTIIAVSRGDRQVSWIRSSEKGPQVVRRLRDARLLDPVLVEAADTHGIETPLLTVADFKGRKIVNYRCGEVVFATQGGARFGLGSAGKDEFECGGVLEIPGSPFAISATNVN